MAAKKKGSLSIQRGAVFEGIMRLSYNVVIIGIGL